MTKKITALFISLLLSAFALTGCNSSQEISSSAVSITASEDSDVITVASGNEQSASDSSSDSTGDQSDTGSSDNSGQTVASDMFSDGDYKDVTSETPNAEITLSGTSAEISDSTRGSYSSGVLTITSKGIYKVTGSSENVSIVVNDSSKSGNIYLILDGVTMTNDSTACINVQSADKVIIQCTGTNSLTSSSTSSSLKEDGAIYAKDDLTINGSGTLSVSSGLHGIVCKDDLKITDGTITVDASSAGLKAGQSVKIGGGTVNITAGHDGIHLDNDDNTSSFYFEKAALTVTAGQDGISVKAGDDNAEFTGYVTLNGGTINITTASGSGADSSKDSNTSQKGIKSDGDITVSDTVLTVSAADDAIHGNASVTINSGTVKAASSDDGITASEELVINGGTVEVTKSYEGLEGKNITINSGDVKVYASDDGLNCSGGSDTTSQDDSPWNSSGTDAKLTINGGNVYVNASGDGLDSNGSIYITGGTVIIEGPSSAGNGAIDKGDGNGCVAEITGGTVLAIGTSDMAINFDSGTQCSALVSLSGDEGTVISVDDGSGFTFTATKSYSSVVYSSPSLTQGGTVTITSGSESAQADFSSSLYYSEVTGMGGMGGQGGMGGPGR